MGNEKLIWSRLEPWPPEARRLNRAGCGRVRRKINKLIWGEGGAAPSRTPDLYPLLTGGFIFNSALFFQRQRGGGLVRTNQDRLGRRLVTISMARGSQVKPETAGRRYLSHDRTVHRDRTSKIPPGVFIALGDPETRAPQCELFAFLIYES